MLKLKEIEKTYEGNHALHRTDLTIAPGKTTVLIGPSGCGKSTLLRLIAGLILPDKGEIKIHDSTLTRDNLLAWRHQLGYVIQEGGLFPHLTAKDNVCLMAKYLKWEAEAIEKRLNELAELVRLPYEMLQRYPMELSGGQRQRISLMRALMLDPEFLLLDEPLGALDPMIRYELQKELKEIFESLHKTVILVTHDLAEAVHFCDELVLMREGKIIQRGTLQQLLSAPAEPFVEEFVRAQQEPLRKLHAILI
jgi:osmoprotectant transport system ATP-binding protein